MKHHVNLQDVAVIADQLEEEGHECAEVLREFLDNFDLRSRYISMTQLLDSIPNLEFGYRELQVHQLADAVQTLDRINSGEIPIRYDMHIEMLKKNEEFYNENRLHL